MDSAGSAMAENAKWLDSIEGKTYQFTNALETMWSNMLDSNIVKGVIDFATKAIQFLDSAPGKITAVVAAVAGFAKFKGFSLMGLGQDTIKSLQSVVSAKATLDSLSAVSPANMTMPTASIQAYAAAVSNLTAKQQANMLASTGLNKAQIQLALQYNGLSDDVIREATAHVFAAQTAGQENISDQQLLQSKILLSAASLKLTGDTDALAAAKFLEAEASHWASAADAKQAIMASTLSDAQKAAALAAIGQANANMTLGASFKALFASNPIGLILTLATTIGTIVVPIIEKFHKSASELKEEVEELTTTYEEAKKTFSENLTSLTTSSDTELYATLEDEFKHLTKGVDEYGNNLSLTSDQYERYKEICEQIVGINPDIAAGYESATKAIGNNASALSQLIELQKQQARQNVKDLLTVKNIEAIGENAFNDMKKAKDRIKEAQDTYLYGGNDTGLSNILYQAYNWNDIGTKEYGDKSNNGDDLAKKVLQAIGMDDDAINKALKKYYNKHGYWQGSQFIEDYWDDIYNNAHSLPSEVQDWANEFKDVAEHLLGEADGLAEAKNGLIDKLLQVPLGEEAYDNLNDGSKSFITEWIKNNELFKIDPDADETEVQAQLKSNIALIQQLVNEFGSNVQNIEYNGKKFTAQELLEQVYDFDLSSVSYDEYIAQMDKMLRALYFSLSEETRQSVSMDDLSIFLFNIDIKETQKNIDQAKKQIASYIGKAEDDISDYLSHLTAEEVQVFASIDWNAYGPDTITNWESVLKIIRQQMAVYDELGTKTYSTLVESVEKYNEILAQTKEIIADNTIVTQEYKDSLLELGISESDLADCFDENNPLIVKNASVLNKLVANTKKTTAQNISLAKSQARLKYYEKFKELKQLTNGKKVETAATLNQVKAIYAEMTALQKSISKYSMLEHQLLGATNAYETFAKAQEIDSENDYESKAEELVGYLVDAFHTAKLGTESAQAAIKGLVPESVYEDLDTLDDKMAAVYDYFTTDLSKYFYVKFNDDGSLESAEMLIDNVKQFVDDGIAKGVFTGSWEEWDLDPTISSLDDLAKKMGVTQEVAYAFLQAMETYDISWIGGDASTLLDKLIPSTAEIQTLKDQIQSVFDDSPIDLTTRLNISTEQLKEKGYDGYSTTFNSSDFGLYNEDGSSFEILATPVLPNGDILGKDELSDYISKQIGSGKSLEEVDVFVGSYADLAMAEEAAATLDQSLKYYADRIKNYSLESAITTNTQKQAELEYKIATGEVDADTIVSADGVTTASQQLAQLRDEAEANAKAARENIAAWHEAKGKYDDAAKAVEDCNKELENAQKLNDPDKISEATKNLADAEDKLWDTYDALVEIGEPREVVLTVAEEQVQKDIEEIEKSLKSTFDNFTIEGKVYNLEDFVIFDSTTETYKVNYELVPDGVSTTELEKYVGLLNEQYTIDALQGEGITTTLDVLTEIKDILSKTYELMVKTDDAQTKVQSFADIWNSLRDKSVTLWQTIKQNIIDAGTPGASGGGSVNGTAHTQGTAFAGGSWGAKNTETALVGELGPELLVRGNRWTTIGDNGAEFTQVKKGDIIFNHKQTESLLKNGHVTSRGKAYASGTAFVGGATHPWTGGMNIDNDWQNIDATIWNAATNGEYLADSVGDASDALSDASDAADEFAETLDWIEIRLEEINEDLDLMNAQLENAGTYASKNNIIDQMIGVNNTKMKNLTAGIKEYSEYAAKLLADVPAQYREAAQNGAIDITEFTGEANEATVEAIDKYREWAQKVADLTQQLEETKTEIRDLAIQKYTNIYDAGDVRTTVEDSQTEKLQNAVDLIEESGNIADSAYYTAMMENSGKKVEYWTKTRNEMQKAFNEMVASGKLERGSDEWYEQLNKLYEVDAAIDEATIELEEYQNAINDIYWDNFDELINRLDYIEEETQSLIDLMDNADMVITPETEDGWRADQVEWTEEGIASLGLYAQQMETAEYKSKQYAKAIEDLNKDYKAGKYSESEYLEKLNELKDAQYDAIESYYDAQDAIKELNETRVDAIKEGIEKEIEAYEKLINKKKEELDAEKDLYDWQKSTMEQQKTIADIERKLAALSADNSASAVAKRKKLESELAQEKAKQEEMYYERSIDQRGEALDKELEDFQAEKDAEIEKWDKYLEDIEVIIAESLGIVQDNAVGVYNTLSDKASEYNLTLSDAILTPWQDGALAVSDYQSTFDTAMSSTTEQLESLRKGWQSVIDTMAKAGNANVGTINKENANYAAAKKLASQSSVTPIGQGKSSTSTSSSASTNTGTPSVGSTVTVKSSATNFGSKSGNVKMASFVPGGTYTVYEISGDQILIGKNGAYTGWVKKSDLQGYAKGAISVDEDQLAWIDELGEELQFVPGANGRLEYVKRGTGIVPADLTQRIMDLAMNPQEVLDRNRPQITPSKSVINNNMEIKVDASVGTLLHVEHLDGNNPDEVIKIVDKAWDKKMQGLNNAMRKFTR